MGDLLYPWEKTLHNKAFDALNRSMSDSKFTPIESEELEKSYEYCSNVTKQHSKTFFLASSLLPKTKRKAARALYAFCRVSDDLVDCGTHDLMEALELWRARSLHDHVENKDEVLFAWSNTRKRYGIPKYYGEQLIQGVAQDLIKNRYSSFDELAEYCYGVACTVGLMAMFIIGYKDESAFQYAIRLGVALQITNILRDVGEDWERGRLYLPQDELDKFGISEDDIEKGIVTDRWREFMRFQIDRNRRLYMESLPGIALLNKDGRFSIGAAGELYQLILDEIEKNDYDVFTKRAFVKPSKKLGQLPAIWYHTAFNRYPTQVYQQVEI